MGPSSPQLVQAERQFHEQAAAGLVHTQTENCSTRVIGNFRAEQVHVEPGVKKAAPGLEWTVSARHPQDRMQNMPRDIAVHPEIGLSFPGESPDSQKKSYIRTKAGQCSALGSVCGVGRSHGYANNSSMVRDESPTLCDRIKSPRKIFGCK